jgi:hypothetical protein
VVDFFPGLDIDVAVPILSTDDQNFIPFQGRAQPVGSPTMVADLMGIGGSVSDC